MCEEMFVVLAELSCELWQYKVGISSNFYKQPSLVLADLITSICKNTPGHFLVHQHMKRVSLKSFNFQNSKAYAVETNID